MFLTLAATVLPLVPISADDERLDKKRTFVSAEAQLELAKEGENRVLCLDRRRSGSICLTETQWTTAIELAKTAPKKGPGAFIPQTLPEPSHSSPFSGTPIMRH